MIENQKTITVKVKNVYGNELVYPVSEAAKIFADLARQKTLTRETLNLIKSLGYEIKVSQDVLAL